MAEQSGFFPDVNGDRQYTTNFLADWVKSFISNGVYNGELAVTAGDGMTVKIPAGRAWINGYYYHNDSELTLTIDNADGVLNRIDVVVLRWDVNVRSITAQIIKGEPASTAMAPNIVRTEEQYDLKLAEISIPAGTTKITQSLITDCRLDNDVCGIVHAVIDQIDTSSFMKQLDDWASEYKDSKSTEFTEWFDAIKGKLSKDVAGSLQNQIDNITNNLASHKNENATGAHKAKNIAIEDAGGHFSATDVEGALNELFSSVSDGKTQLETAITDKGGTVSKAGNVATFDELDDGIRSIPVGDYAIGGTISDFVLRVLPGGMGVEIWSKTDVVYGFGIAVDSTGNVYVTHDVSGKAVRKLDSGGNEIWSNTDVSRGQGIAVDSAGNVYVAHNVSGGKAVRKLDSAGNEIWSKTGVPYGYGIAVDSAGNVYVTHDVSSGKAVRKLDSGGNEIWSRTDVPYGQGIAVDSAGNVYVTHDVSTGEKAVRKLDSGGNEIWSKTDVPNGRGIAVDSTGNVYVTHDVSTGEKAVRKLDSGGNEIWSRTDVPYGQGIAVDSTGNVYVTHDVSGKAVRKLDSGGNEIWSKTDVPNGRGIAVDSTGNVYVTHDVSTGEKAVRKLDGNKYFQIVG